MNAKTILTAGLVALAATALAAAQARAADLPAAPALDGAAGDAVPSPARAPIFVRVGGTATTFDPTLTARLAGVPVPGAKVGLGAVGSAYAEVGAFVTDAVAVSLSAGVPPTIAGTGRGSLAGYGPLLRVTEGTPVLAATYHLGPFLGLRPYLGAGLAYGLPFSTEHGALVRPRLRGAPGLALVAGVDYALDDHWSVFVDAKRLFLEQRYSGLVSPAPGVPPVAPVRGSLRSDPLLVSAGIGYAF